MAPTSLTLVIRRAPSTIARACFLASPGLLHYKARNFPRSLSEDDLAQWEVWRAQHLQAQLPQFMASLQRLAPTATDEQQFIVQELQLWLESVLPAIDS